MQKRREDNFIEDDDGNGYVDFGQDDWDDAEYSGDDEAMVKRAKGEQGERKKGVFNNLAPKKKKVCARERACVRAVARACGVPRLLTSPLCPLPPIRGRRPSA